MTSHLRVLAYGNGEEPEQPAEIDVTLLLDNLGQESQALDDLESSVARLLQARDARLALAALPPAEVRRALTERRRMLGESS